jgi:hypothetical protein
MKMSVQLHAPAALSPKKQLFFSVCYPIRRRIFFPSYESNSDRLCGLVVRVLGYRSGGPGSIPGTTRKKVVGLEQGPLSLVSTTEELLDRKVAAAVKKTERIRPEGIITLTTWHPLSAQVGGRSVGIVRSRTQTMDGV